MPETQKDIGTEPQGVVRRWKLELELADKQERDWRKDAERVIDRYRGEDYRTDRTEGGSEIKKNAFNILWSNTETLRPALYNSTPAPRVRRRFRDKDDVGRAVSEVLERALKYSVDAYDFDRTMMLAVDDYLLPGRGVTRVRYVPTIDQDGDSEELTYEEVQCEHVNWADFRRGPGRTWDEVTWIAFLHRLNRDQLVKKFGKDKGNRVKLDLTLKDDGDERKKDEDDTEREVFDRAEVWEVWDKTERKVLFINKSMREPLSVEDDPLNLEDFFPIPRPLYAMESSTSLVPVPDYQLYETLARELDRVTGRIMRILDGLRLRGIYDSTLAELDRLFEAGDNRMIPAENLAKIIQQGGIKASIWMLPVDTYASVLENLYNYRAALIQSIYEITGVSDILRGRSDARETARAQEIKSNWGTLRLQKRQREVQRYARDLIRLKAEIIAENFQPETLQLMTGLEYPTEEQKAQAQRTLQQTQQQLQMMQAQMGPDAEIPPEIQRGIEAAQNIISTPSWEQIKKVMSNDLLRGFKVEIETDSTIAEQMTEEKQDVVEMLRGLVEFANGVGSATQMGLMPPKAIKSLLLAAVRRFKLGEEVEDAIEEAEVDEGQEGPDPEQQKAELEAQVEMEKLRMERERAKEEHEAKMRQLAMEAEFKRAQHQWKMRELQVKTQSEVMEQQAQAEHDVIKNRAEAQGDMIKEAAGQ